MLRCSYRHVKRQQYGALSTAFPSIPTFPVPQPHWMNSRQLSVYIYCLLDISAQLPLLIFHARPLISLLLYCSLISQSASESGKRNSNINKWRGQCICFTSASVLPVHLCICVVSRDKLFDIFLLVRGWMETRLMSSGRPQSLSTSLRIVAVSFLERGVRQRDFWNVWLVVRITLRHGQLCDKAYHDGRPWSMGDGWGKLPGILWAQTLQVSLRPFLH